MCDYKKLRVWQRAVDLYGEVKRISLGFPKYENYSLGDQMRRSAESISIKRSFRRKSYVNLTLRETRAKSTIKLKMEKFIKDCSL